MLTACGICGCALVVPQGEDASAFCAWCTRANFGGQQGPERDAPPVLLAGMRRFRGAMVRLAARHREEEA